MNLFFDSFICSFIHLYIHSCNHVMIYIFAGNAVLLVIVATLGHRYHWTGLNLIIILQIVFILEVLICLPGIIWYLGKCQVYGTKIIYSMMSWLFWAFGLGGDGDLLDLFIDLQFFLWVLQLSSPSK